MLFEEEGLKPPSEHGLTLAVVLLEPRSSGTVLLRSADPRVPPAIDPRYLTDPGGEDAATLLRGLRLARRVLAQEPLASLVDAEILPGADARSDDALLAHIRALSQTLYHPAGTCRMGSDVGSVVDPQLRVRGIAGLRIADASVIPKLPHGHTNWPTVMIAERASELVAAALARRLVDEPRAHESSVLDLEHPGARDRRLGRPVERHTRARDEVDDLEHDVAVRAARDRTGFAARASRSSTAGSPPAPSASSSVVSIGSSSASASGSRVCRQRTNGLDTSRATGSSPSRAAIASASRRPRFVSGRR